MDPQVAQPDRPPRHNWFWRCSIVTLALVPLSLGMFWFGSGDSSDRPILATTAVSVNDPRTKSPPVAAPSDLEAEKSDSPKAGTSNVSSEDQRNIELFLGQWTNHFHGPRYLTIRSDGSGEMVSEPEGMGARIFAARMRFDLNWTLRGNEIVLETTGGEPEGKVKLVLRLFGSRRVHTIQKLEADEMILVDDDGETKHTWTRVLSDDEPPAAENSTVEQSAVE